MLTPPGWPIAIRLPFRSWTVRISESALVNMCMIDGQIDISETMFFGLIFSNLPAARYASSDMSDTDTAISTSPLSIRKWLCTRPLVASAAASTSGMFRLIRSAMPAPHW